MCVLCVCALLMVLYFMQCPIYTCFLDCSLDFVTAVSSLSRTSQKCFASIGSQKCFGKPLAKAKAFGKAKSALEDTSQKCFASIGSLFLVPSLFPQQSLLNGSLATQHHFRRFAQIPKKSTLRTIFNTVIVFVMIIRTLHSLRFVYLRAVQIHYSGNLMVTTIWVVSQCRKRVEEEQSFHTHAQENYANQQGVYSYHTS